MAAEVEAVAVVAVPMDSITNHQVTITQIQIKNQAVTQINYNQIMHFLKLFCNETLTHTL